MVEFDVNVSAHPDSIGTAASLADGIEIKLDWEHAAKLTSGRTLSDHCQEQGVPADTVTSVHLPPGKDRRYGMSIAAGNVGRITDFTHNPFGSQLSPEWLTVHSARQFDYRDHVERLAKITELTGYPIAVENTPDDSYFHAPEELAVFALLSDSVDRLKETQLLIDTAHVDGNRRQYAVDETVVSRIIDRLGSELADRLEEELREFVGHNLAEAEETLPRSDPWRPVLTTLYAVGGSRVRALHLNDPESDGLPNVGHDGSDGLDHVLRYCREHEVAVVLEPGPATNAEIREVVHGLRDRMER